jgi:hypothetical protein
VVVPSALLLWVGWLNAMTDQTNSGGQTPDEHPPVEPGDNQQPTPQQQPAAEQPAAEHPTAEHPAVEPPIWQPYPYTYPPTAAGQPAPPPYPYGYPYPPVPYPPVAGQPQQKSGLSSWRPSHKAVMVTCWVIIGISLLVGAGAIGYNLHPDTPERSVSQFVPSQQRNDDGAPYFRFNGQPPKRFGSGGGSNNGGSQNQLPQAPNQLPNPSTQPGSGSQGQSSSPSSGSTTSP